MKFETEPLWKDAIPPPFSHSEKTELFLELFGNSLLRAQAAEYLKEKATDLIQ